MKSSHYSAADRSNSIPFVRVFGLAALALVLAQPSALANVIHNEGADGDFSNDGSIPTGLTVAEGPTTYGLEFNLDRAPQAAPDSGPGLFACGAFVLGLSRMARRPLEA